MQETVHLAESAAIYNKNWCHKNWSQAWDVDLSWFSRNRLHANFVLQRSSVFKPDLGRLPLAHCDQKELWVSKYINLEPFRDNCRSAKNIFWKMLLLNCFRALYGRLNEAHCDRRELWEYEKTCESPVEGDSSLIHPEIESPSTGLYIYADVTHSSLNGHYGLRSVAHKGL